MFKELGSAPPDMSSFSGSTDYLQNDSLDILSLVTAPHLNQAIRGALASLSL